MKKGNLTGTYYFIVHVCVEMICFYVLRRHYSFIVSGTIALLYDFVAFMPQGLIGDFIIKHKKIPYETIGHLLMLLSVFLVLSDLSWIYYTGFIALGIGNAILHECGAIATVAESEGKIFPSALFVSGGSFGLVIGETLGTLQVTPLILILPFVVSEVCAILEKESVRRESYPVFRCVKGKISLGWILGVAFLVTAVRSYLAYAIPISWKKEIWQSFLLFFVMGFGKALGGYFADRVGLRKTATFATLASIPFLVFGDNAMVLSVIGVCFFSMTMCITFAMCLSVLPRNPGMAFGVTTAALFLGLMPLCLGRFGLLTNAILITVFSVVCAVLLLMTLKEREKPEDGRL